MLRSGPEYVGAGQQVYEQQYCDWVIAKLKLQVHVFGFTLIQREEESSEPDSVAP